MSDYIELPVKNILKEGQTTKPGFCNTKYVVYFDPSRPVKRVHVNTNYSINGDTIKMNRYYDRGLCETPEDFEYFDKLKPEYIERQAYDAYMDGAR